MLLHEAEAILDADDLGGRAGARELELIDVGNPDVTDLALALELDEGAHRLLHGDAGVDEVELVQVDPLKAEAPQAASQASLSEAGRQSASHSCGPCRRKPPLVATRSPSYGWSASRSSRSAVSGP